MKKRILSLLLSAVMVMGLAVGCGSDDNGGASDGEAKKYDGVELTMWSMWSDGEPQSVVIKEAAAAFEEETGAKVNIEWKGRDVQQLILAALEQGEKIDIFEEDYQRISKNYADYVLDLTEMADAAGYADKSFACFNNVATEWAGFLPAITEQPQVGGIYYDKDDFAAAGIDTLPATWDEFLAACDKLVAAGYAPMALDSAYADFHFGYHLERYLGEATVSELSKNGGWSDNAQAVAAADSMIEFVKKGYFVDGAPDEYPASQNKMGLDGGKVAMVVCANYICAEVNNTTQANINWGLMNYPTVEGGVTTTNAYAGANSLAIPKTSENEQAAFDFCLYLTTGTYDKKMADTCSQIPADPSNEAPAIMDGTVEVLKSAEAPLSWSMGLGDSGDKMTALKDEIVKLFEGKYNSGAEWCAAVDALY